MLLTYIGSPGPCAELALPYASAVNPMPSARPLVIWRSVTLFTTLRLWKSMTVQLAYPQLPQQPADTAFCVVFLFTICLFPLLCMGKRKAKVTFYVFGKKFLSLFAAFACVLTFFPCIPEAFAFCCHSLFVSVCSLKPCRLLLSQKERQTIKTVLECRHFLLLLACKVSYPRFS